MNEPTTPEEVATARAALPDFDLPLIGERPSAAIYTCRRCGSAVKPDGVEIHRGWHDSKAHA